MKTQSTIKDKILVIKPPFNDFPVGIAYVLSCLERHGIPFDFVDTTLETNYEKYLKRNHYFAVTTGGLMGFHEFFYEVCQAVHKFQPNTPVILGGNITRDVKEEFLFDKIGMDFGIIGEAETSLPQILHAIYNKSDNFDEIPGLIYKDGKTGQSKKNPPSRLDLQMEKIIPGWQYINMDFYIGNYSMPFMGKRRAVPVLTGRGCVGRCGFCSPTIGAFRKRPIEHVIEEIKFLISQYSFDEIAIFNEMFYQENEDIINFCREYKNAKIDKSWSVSLRPDAKINSDTLILMKKAGCICISVGIESGSDKILKIMRKGITRDQIINFYRLSQKAGIPCCGTFIIGYEDETECDLAETFDMVINEDMITDYSLLRAYPGTAVYRSAVKKGLILDEWDYFQKLKKGSYSPFGTASGNKDYLNVTSIPNSNFWDIIVEQSRRFHTHQFRNHQIKDLKCNAVTDNGNKKYELTGLCPICNNRIKVFIEKLQFPPECNPDGSNCSMCFSTVVFNTYQCSESYLKYYNFLHTKLKEANKIAIFGTGENAVKIWRTNYFDMDYEKIVGFFTVHPQNLCSINMKLLSLDDVLDARPDLIIVTENESISTMLILQLAFIKNNVKVPMILSLNPDFKIKYVRDDNEQKAANQYSNVISKILKVKIITNVVLLGSIIYLKIITNVVLLGSNLYRKIFSTLLNFSVRLYSENNCIKKVVDYSGIKNLL